MKGKFLGLIVLMVYFCSHYCGLNVRANEIEWNKEFYNPNENSDGLDFILPLPDGGAVTFRPVAIVQDKVVEAKVFSLGNQRFVPVEYPIDGSVSGVFESGQGGGGTRLYYIGKYEITESQFDAVINSKKLQKLSRNPKVDLSWFEAVQFCNMMTIWLLKNNPNLMPLDDKTLGYIRLPTEEEWEFACRGGEVVSSNFFYRDNFIPDDEKVTDYVQYYRSGDITVLQPIGKTKKPNPLGIYDMLGNAGEMCFNLFRLNYNYGRLGGFVVKGGHLKLLEPTNMRSSIRFEAPFYDDKEAEPHTNRFHGFRVVVAAPLYTSLQRTEKIANEWNEDMLPSKGQLRLSFEEALRRLDHVYNRITDPDLKRDLLVIKHSQDNIARELHKIELNDAVVFFRIGSYSANVIAIQAQRLSQMQSLLGDYGNDRSKDEKFITQIEESRRKIEKGIEQDLETYGDAVESLYRKYRNSPGLVTDACSQAIEKKRLLKQENFIPALNLMLGHVKKFKQRNAVMWRKDIRGLRRIE